MASLRAMRISIVVLLLLVLSLTAWMVLYGHGLNTSRELRTNGLANLGKNKDSEDESPSSFMQKKPILLKSLKQCLVETESLKKRLSEEFLHSAKGKAPNQEETCVDMNSIRLIINKKREIKALEKDNNVFVPFSVLKEEFEIHGDFNKNGVFEWRHAVIRPWVIPNEYDPAGPYAGLEKASVENRKRVKCIDGLYGVPVTTQWDKDGYFYATQIAQYGLAHYGSQIAKDSVEEKFVIYQGNKKGSLAVDGKFETVYSQEKAQDVTFFKGKASIPKELIQKEAMGLFLLSFDVKLEKGSEIWITLKLKHSKPILIKYVEDVRGFISCSNSIVQIRLGFLKGWRTVVRDLRNDISKGMALCKGSKNKEARLVRIERITFVGSGYIGEIKASQTAHTNMFINAAQWLIKFQDEQGGWPVNVTRKIIPGVSTPSGWRSAMASGQAISLFCRVYLHTKQAIYLDAALRALKLFKLPVSENGVVSKVFGNMTMFEEYPGNPSLHVLNGFIFSLIGLWDLSQVKKDCLLAQELFNEGFRTLLRILPMYDNGSGTFYDLRHIAIPGIEPRRARWDYHAVHLGQLELLLRIKKHPVIEQILTRWKEYVNGKPAHHN